MLNVEQAIREVRAVYEALTGRPIEATGADLPPVVDPQAHIEARYRQFRALLEAPAGGAGRTQEAPAWWPAVDVIEAEREVRCEIDLPGTTREQVSVSLVGDHVVVRGRRTIAPPAGGAVRHAERLAGPFQRVIALPPRARREVTRAVLQDGVLSIAFPTGAPDAEAASIPIDPR